VEFRNHEGSVRARTGETVHATEKSAPKRLVEDLALRFARQRAPLAVKARPQIATLPLPLDLDRVVNYKEAARALDLAGVQERLRRDGFVVLGRREHENIAHAYQTLREQDVPFFITADAVLHLSRVQFNETLRALEERAFTAGLIALGGALLRHLDAQELSADAKELHAAREQAMTYLAVGLRLLDPAAKLPARVDGKTVSTITAQIEAGQGTGPLPGFGRSEDFTEYRPEGHYTRSAKLQRYYLATTWLGRVRLLLQGEAGPARTEDRFPVSAKEARQQTQAAALLAGALATAVLPDGRKARDVWERIYIVTSFYTGLSEDLGPQQYLTAVQTVCGSALNVAELVNADKLHAVRLELAKMLPTSETVKSGTDRVSKRASSPEEILTQLDPEAGFLFFGRRASPDAYLFGRLVYPALGPPTRADMFTYGKTKAGAPIRALPRGLDLMAVLSNPEARSWLRKLGDDAYRAEGDAAGYDEALARLQREFGRLDEIDWNRNLYWSWLYTLKPLLAEYGAGYQPFMTTPAYRTRTLNTALASWAQLRHDTILYSRRSVTPEPGMMLELTKARKDDGREIPGKKSPKKEVLPGYVEPLPELYARLATLARMTREELSRLDVLDGAGQERLAHFEGLLVRLVTIAEKELLAQPLDRADQVFIVALPDQFEQAVVARDKSVLPGLEQELAVARFGKDEKQIKKVESQLLFEEYVRTTTVSVAAVHRDTNSDQVLQEATGYLDLGVFLYQLPDGRLVLGAGPVLSYYEFRQPARDRLTDRDWRRQLDAETGPERPEWSRAYLAQ
jgi:hypothetical protein